MYKEMVNNNVVAIVATRGDTFLKYKGLFLEENVQSIILQNVDICSAFNDNLHIEKNKKVSQVILNKEYIISCNMN